MSGTVLDRLRAIFALRDASSVQKAILASLELRANNETGESWPSLQRIADDAGASKSTTKANLRALEEGGKLSRRRRHRAGTGESVSTVYVVQVGREPAYVGREMAHLGQEPANGGPGDGLQVGQEPAGGRPAAGPELPRELPRGTTNGTAKGTGAAPQLPLVDPGKGEIPRAKADLHSEVFETWITARRKKFGLKGVKPKLDRDRRRVIDERQKDGYSVEDLKAAVIGYVLNDENKHASRAEGFVWALESAAKVDEGIERLREYRATRALAPEPAVAGDPEKARSVLEVLYGTAKALPQIPSRREPAIPASPGNREEGGRRAGE